jgi:YidC/Oxa1 family membrane protein insertase
MILREIVSYLRFLWATPKVYKDVVIYSENESYYPIFEGILQALIRDHGQPACYVTSDPHDPILTTTEPCLRGFYVDKLLNLFMRFANCRVMVMTLTDLGNYQLGRSINPVHYVYMFHSICSTHMGYRRGAFDNYDSILCTSPHQVEEIRRAEALYGLKPKILIEAGYHRLERVHEAYGRWQGQAKEQRRPVVLIAPTWSRNNLLEAHVDAIVSACRGASYAVVLRLHPETVKRQPQFVASLKSRFGGDPMVELEMSVAGDESLLEADVLVTDWSGAALEYAFGTERPAIFIDVPRKVNNDAYEELEIEPFEVTMRRHTGVIIAPEDIPRIGATIDRLVMERDGYRRRLATLRSRHVFGWGRSSEIGARHIMHLLGAAGCGPSSNHAD